MAKQKSRNVPGADVVPMSADQRGRYEQLKHQGAYNGWGNIRVDSWGFGAKDDKWGGTFTNPIDILHPQKPIDHEKNPWGYH